MLERIVEGLPSLVHFAVGGAAGGDLRSARALSLSLVHFALGGAAGGDLWCALSLSLSLSCTLP